MILPPSGDDWVALSTGPVPFDQLTSWPVLPSCGALVVFAGTVRDHAEGRPGVVSLEYEAYADVAAAQMRWVAAELRQRWPEVGRVALVHRAGLLVPGDISVVVSISAPHRAEAFEAARFGIDAIKARVPIWKRETWQGGAAWGAGTHPLEGAWATSLSEYGRMSSLGS